MFARPSRLLSSVCPRIRHWTSFAPVDTPVPGLHIEAFDRTFPYMWLRDSCPALIHPSTQQRLHRSSDISPDVKPSQVTVSEDNYLNIEWNDGHRSSFHKDFLERYSSPAKVDAFHRDVEPVSWKAPDLEIDSAKAKMFVGYRDLQNPEILSSAIDQLLKTGLLFLTGVPTEGAEDSALCEVKQVANLLGKLKDTFYGDSWDVMSVSGSKNIAYTNLFLDMHMDLLYFEHPPQYQILHCIKNQVRGGESLFVDALHAAQRLRDEHWGYFEILANTPVPFHYINNNHHLHFSHPTIELVMPSGDNNSLAKIGSINYSPPFQAPLPVDTPVMFYSALAQFAKYLDEPSSVYRYLLKEGDAVVFDNRRVLHARNAFEDIPGTKPDTSNRWLKGCYFDGDSLLDRGRILRKKYMVV